MSDCRIVSQHHRFVMIHQLMVVAQLALHYMRAGRTQGGRLRWLKPPL